MCDERRSGLTPPQNIHLPVAVYGSLRPGELAYRQIQSSSNHLGLGEIEGFRLMVLDGLPMLTPADSKARVQLLQLEDVGYRVIGAFEPKDLYKWNEATVSTSTGRVQANVLVARDHIHPRSSEYADEWRSADDPMLVAGPVTVRRYSMRYSQTIVSGWAAALIKILTSG